MIPADQGAEMSRITLALTWEQQGDLLCDLRLAMLAGVRRALGTEPRVWHVAGRELHRERQVEPQDRYPLAWRGGSVWGWGL